MSCNLCNNEAELRSAFEAVSNSQNGNEWAIFEYDATSNIVMLGQTGNAAGFQELLENFHTGKVQYGFGTIGGSLLPGQSSQGQRKVIMIHWQGEGVPAARLATTASHVEEIRRFVRRVNMTIYARSEEDLDREALAKHFEKLQEIAPNAIGNGTNNAVGAFVPSLTPLSAPPPAPPAASPAAPFAPISAPLPAPPHAPLSAPLPVPLHVLPTVPPPAPPSTPSLSSSSTPFIPPTPVGTHYQKPRPKEEMDMEEREKFWNEMRNEEELRRKEEAERRRQMQEQFAKEHKDLTAQLHKAHLEKLEAQKVQHPQMEKSLSLDAAGAGTQSKKGKLIAGRTQMFEQKVAELVGSVKPMKKPKNFKWQVSLQGNSSATPVNRVPEPPPKQFECVLKRKEPQISEMAVANEKQPTIVEQPPQEPTINKVLPINPVPPIARQPPPSIAQQEFAVPEAEKNGKKEEECPLAPMQISETVGKGNVDEIRAKALWDYQAEDQTELSFNPDDVITQIQMVNDGWWYGRAPNGIMGLFPSNYVQLI